jgi:predicted amidohydrolase
MNILSFALFFIPIVLVDADYTAAVLELAPMFLTRQVNETVALSVQLSNLARFARELSAAGTALDIAVLGEYALYGTYLPTRAWLAPYAYELPRVADGVCACGNATWQRQSPVLARVSCLARQLNAYLVVDVAERALCGAPGVPAVARRCVAGVDPVFFNTQIAVARDGVLIAVYRKSHLYFEPMFDEPLVPDVVWFDTDFGVRFGALICFDIMFEQPGKALRQLGVAAFVYSTWWVDEAPLINGIQTQAAFANAFNVTILAAGIGVSNRQSGSGIYAGAQTLVSTYNPTQSPRTRLLVARVPTSTVAQPSALVAPPERPAPQQLSSNFTVVPFSAVTGSGSVSGTQGGVSCRFTYRAASGASTDLFAVLVLDGLYNGLFPLSLCAAVRCASAHVSSCANQFTLNSSTVFDSWRLSTVVRGAPQLTWYAMTAGDAGVQLGGVDYQRSATAPTLRASRTSEAFLSATLWGLHWT